MESFYTIQGEGFNTGKAAYFIRLGGCDVGCVWCDVKDSWDSGKHPLFEVSSIVEKALMHPGRNVVITGGEPCMYELSELTSELLKNGFSRWIETSGAYEITGSFDWICVSPKKFKAPLDSALAMAHELKCIVYNRHDFSWAEEQASKTSQDCILFLQPEWSKKEQVLPLIVDYVKQNPKWQISLQTHKYLNIP